jgi:DNA-binding response OmpR family regulator
MMADRRVLLIDASDDQRSLLANALRARGWRVEIARNGKQGFDAAARVQPEIVVTELVLPDIRGFDFARSLRTAVEHDLLVIALTCIPEALHKQVLAAGFDHVVGKPFSVEQLCVRMRALAIARAS